MKVLIAAGGTAGHINPALAIAGEIKARCPQAEVHFAGRKKGMEYGLVTRAGYPFHPIEVNGIQRKLTPKNVVRNAVALYHLALSAPRAAAILNEVQPGLVIGAGGYVSGPVVQAAQRRGIPTAIHEQNAFPGVTNKILAKHASAVLAAMPDAVERLGAPERTVVVGNPVRAEMFRADRAAARRALGVQPGQIVIVSFGGSLGAQVLNERVADLAVWELANRNFRHIHATGSIEKADFAALSEKLGIAHDKRFEIREYIDDMPALLGGRSCHQPRRRPDTGRDICRGPGQCPDSIAQCGREPSIPQCHAACKAGCSCGFGGKAAHRRCAGSNGRQLDAGPRPPSGNGCQSAGACTAGFFRAHLA